MVSNESAGPAGRLNFDLRGSRTSFKVLAITSGKIGRVWDEGFNSDLGIETSVVLVLSKSTSVNPMHFCYVRLKTPATLITVGDQISWKANQVWWKSKNLEQVIETERIGKSFINYNTSESFMISEWRELE